jgi:beta-lactamase class A
MTSTRRDFAAIGAALGLLSLVSLGCAASAPPPSTDCRGRAVVLPGATAEAAGSSPEAAPATPEAAIQRLFGPAEPSGEWFSPSFAAQIPVEKVRTIVRSMKDELGALRAVRRTDAAYECEFEKGVVQAEAHLDGQGRFVRLFFHPPRVNGRTIEASVAAIRALPGKASVLVLTDGKERAGIDADAPLAVASAFKLAVLETLRGQIDAKKRQWSDVVELDPRWRSVPTGFLQTWPAKSPITVYALAALMISQSDNTATDQLVSLVGRAEVERWAQHDRPFLVTREVSILKARPNGNLLARFRAEDEAGRRALLQEVDAKPLGAADVDLERPSALDVEWHFSARELCGLIEKVHELPLMSINPGPASAAEWKSVAYKGGSEPGVLNMTTRVASAKHVHCVVATWNDDTRMLEEPKLFAAYAALLASLHEEG